MSYVKHLVSKKKRRFIEDGFDLDLAYIKPNIVAMGFPSENLEGVYRNNFEDVLRFLELKHKDKYKVYNLCSERTYPAEKFCNRVGRFGFDDHNAPPFELMLPCCEDMHDWLSLDKDNVAIVHCKAGKGRTGVMICAYLLYVKIFELAEDAMNYYASARTNNDKGVTIPSQRRYIQYFARYMRNNLAYEPRTLLLTSITFVGIPTFNSNTCSPSFIVYQKKNTLLKSKTFEINKSEKEFKLVLPNPLPICGDIKIDFFHKDFLKKERMFVFWLNTFFLEMGMNKIENNHAQHNGEDVDTFQYEKHELDKANKDKKHKFFPEQFKIRLNVIMSKKDSDLPTCCDKTDGSPKVYPVSLVKDKKEKSIVKSESSNSISKSAQITGTREKSPKQTLQNLSQSRIKVSNENLLVIATDNDTSIQPSPTSRSRRLQESLSSPLSPVSPGPLTSLDRGPSRSLEVLTLSEEPLSDDDEEEDESQWGVQCQSTRV